MARHYGFTCDKCKGEILCHSDHFVITLDSVNRDVAQFDLCPNCAAEIFSQFDSIGRSFKLDLSKSV